MFYFSQIILVFFSKREPQKSSRFYKSLFILSPDFHQLWRSMMSICLLTEVKQQWATLVLGWVTVGVLDQLWDVSQLEFLSVTRLS